MRVSHASPTSATLRKSRQATETPVIFQGGLHGSLGVCDASRVCARMAAVCIHTHKLTDIKLPRHPRPSLHARARDRPHILLLRQNGGGAGAHRLAVEPVAQQRLERQSCLPRSYLPTQTDTTQPSLPGA